MQQQQTNQAIPDNLLPSHTFQFLLGDLKAFRGQTTYIYFPVCSGSVSWACPPNLHRETPRRHPNQAQTTSTSFLEHTCGTEHSLCSTIPPEVWASQLGLSQSPSGGNSIHNLTLSIITHTSWPQLRVGSLNTAGHCKPHYCWHSTNSHSTFPSFLHKSPWYLNSLPGGSPPLPNDWRHLESSSMKIKNRFEDKEQPWCCQTPIEKCTAWSPIKQCCSTVEITWIQNVTT